MAKPKTPAQQAAAMVAQMLRPAIASTTQAYADKGASVNEAFKAAAQLQQGVAPAIEQTYGAASSRDAVIAKGLALGAQLAGGQTAGEANQLLAQNNSPQQVKQADIGSVLSSLGGLSASGLNQQGAAFSAAAQFLPTQSRNLGIDALKSARGEGASAVAALNAKRPELIQGALGQMQQSADRQRALDLNETIARSQIGDRAFDNSVSVERLKNDRARIKLQTIQADRNFNVALERLGIQDSGLRLRAAELELKRRNGVGKKGGFTSKQMRDLNADAGALASNAYNGAPPFVDAMGQTVTPPPIGYQEAIRKALDNGIPLVIAQKALNRYYRRGERGRPQLSYQERQAAAKAASAKRRKG